MKKVIYTLILLLVAASGLVFANREIKNETLKNPTPRPLSAAEREAGLKKWEASPDGVRFKKWEASPAGKKVYASIDKIRKQISAFTNMEAVITSLSLPSGSRLGFGVMVKINGDDYILDFGAEESDNNFLSFNNEFQRLHSLKVNDKIIIRSHNVSLAPKYAYPIVSADHVERDSKILYDRPSHKGGC